MCARACVCAGMCICTLVPACRSCMTLKHYNLSSLKLYEWKRPVDRHTATYQTEVEDLLGEVLASLGEVASVQGEEEEGSCSVVQNETFQGVGALTYL